MPWGRLAFAVVDTPVAPALAYVGATGVSLLLALVGALVAAYLPRDGRRAVTLAGLVAVAAALLLPALRPWQSSSDGTLRVAAIQGDVPGDGTDVLAVFRQVTDNQVQATIGLAHDVEDGTQPRPDFVLWPENSTAVDPFADAQTHSGIEAALHAIGVPILVGAMVDAGSEHVMNQGIVWDPALGAGDRYTKRHPVPFGEYIPWRNVFGDSFGKLDMIPRDMLSGTRKDPLLVDGVPVADAICFDIAYDDGLYDQVTHGAQMAVVQTSNAMFIHTSQIEQQFEISRARAIEYGRPLAIASVNGQSGIIAADGSVVASAAPRTTAVIEADVDLDASITPGTYVGHGVARSTGLLTVLALAVAALGYRRRGIRRPPPVVEDDREPEPVTTRSPA
jgi:apolipoprotein N-acyltransferase